MDQQLPQLPDRPAIHEGPQRAIAGGDRQLGRPVRAGELRPSGSDVDEHVALVDPVLDHHRSGWRRSGRRAPGPQGGDRCLDPVPDLVRRLDALEIRPVELGHDLTDPVQVSSVDADVLAVVHAFRLDP
jgi:hypothetical protein